MKKHLITLFKWAWIVAVIVFIIIFFQDNYRELIESLNQIRWYYLILSFLCITLAKIFLILFMYYVIRSVGQLMSLTSCFWVYNISQLGKYLPGNIWHFVGKAAAYKKNGFTPTNIKEALVVENLWLVLSAFSYGFVVIIIFEFDLFMDLILRYQAYFIFFLVLLPAIVILANKLLKIDFQHIVSKYRLSGIIIFLQLLIWTLLGLSFSVLAVPFIPENTSLFMITGLYAIAYSIGFITPFAPAGIGVREGILALGLLPYMPLEIVLLVSAANRLVYLLVEIVLATISQMRIHVKA